MRLVKLELHVKSTMSDEEMVRALQAALTMDDSEPDDFGTTYCAITNIQISDAEITTLKDVDLKLPESKFLGREEFIKRWTVRPDESDS
jgi:hypothetical protein